MISDHLGSRMKITSNLSISRVVIGYPEQWRGLVWVTRTGRRWIFPKFGIRWKDHWFFPFGPVFRP